MEASELHSVGLDVHGREVQLTPDAALAWSKMKRASEADAVELQLISGFRSVARQHEIFERKLSNGDSLEEILRVSAYPAFSEHHTGRAVDIGSPYAEHLTEEFEATPEFRWLSRHAAVFGFILSYPKNNPHGIVYEPWHWVFTEF
ncbi:D-alanyl-D-alanine carboxypeptidase family protein [Opitutaceae bacterium]|nr:D-alanyl-D-alanine carboxypeptidase family protein [Opitutaceae bacterium]